MSQTPRSPLGLYPLPRLCALPGFCAMLCAALCAMLCVLAQPPAAHALSNLPELTALAEKAGPAVVNISTVKTVTSGGELREFFKNRPDMGPFDEFFDQFERFFDEGMPQDGRKERSLGSGFIISSDGYIVTNNHVIAEAEEVAVRLQHNGDKEPESTKAMVVGRDPETDLALLKIETDRELPVLAFGDSDAARVGEWVMAIGNPFGLDHSVTVGIISAKGRVIGAGPFDDFLQTDASINPGNSGGPLLNMDGEVVGINTAIVAAGQGIGFAVPARIAKTVIADLKDGGEVQRGWLGVTIQDVDDNTAKALGLGEAAGALISSVLPDQPAEEAGVRAGDVVTAVNGQDVADASDFLRTIAGYAPGERVRLTLWRKGEAKTLRVKLGQRDVAKLRAGTPTPEAPKAEPGGPVLGLIMRPVTPQEYEGLGLAEPKGLLVTQVAPGSPADEAEVRPGDVVLEANQQPVAGLEDVRKVLEGDAREKGVMMLLLKRQGRNLFRTLVVD